MEMEIADRVNTSSAKPTLPMQYLAIAALYNCWTEIDAEGFPVQDFDTYILGSSLWQAYLAASRPGGFWGNDKSDPPIWLDSPERLPDHSRAFLLSGADGGSKTNKKQSRPLSIIRPIDPSFWQTWRKTERLAMDPEGRLPSKEIIKKTDIFGEGEFAKLSSRPLYLDSEGTAFVQKDANNLLRQGLVDFANFTPEEAACYSARSLRAGYLSHLHATGHPLEEIAKVAAHAATASTKEYFRDKNGVKSKKRLKVSRKKKEKSKFTKVADFLKNLPTFSAAVSAEEAFSWMRKAAQRRLKIAEGGPMSRRTNNAAEEVSNRPFLLPKAWKGSWNLFNPQDRLRAGMKGPLADYIGAVKGRGQCHSFDYHLSPLFFLTAEPPIFESRGGMGFPIPPNFPS